MPGCVSWAALRASRRNRSTSSWDVSTPARGTLIATVRPSSASIARNTWPEGAGPELLEEIEPPQPPGLLGRDAGPDATGRQGPHGLEQSVGEPLLGLRVAGCPPQMRQEPVGRLVERLERAIAQRAALDMLGDQIERGAGEQAGRERPQFVRIGATRRLHVFSPSPGSQLPILERRGVTGHFSVVAGPRGMDDFRRRTRSARAIRRRNPWRPCPILTPGPAMGASPPPCRRPRASWAVPGRAMRWPGTA